MGAGGHGKAPLSTQDSGGHWTRRSKVWFPPIWEFIASVVFIAQSALFVRGGRAPQPPRRAPSTLQSYDSHHPPTTSWGLSTPHCLIRFNVRQEKPQLLSKSIRSGIETPPEKPPFSPLHPHGKSMSPSEISASQIHFRHPVWSLQHQPYLAPSS